MFVSGSVGMAFGVCLVVWSVLGFLQAFLVGLLGLAAGLVGMMAVRDQGDVLQDLVMDWWLGWSVDVIWGEEDSWRVGGCLGELVLQKEMVLGGAGEGQIGCHTQHCPGLGECLSL